MDYSFKEKSIIASLGVTLLIFGWFFYRAFSNLSLGTGNEQLSVNDIITAIILIAILESIIQSFFAIKNKNEEDERDKLIQLSSYRNGYWVLCIGVWFLITHLLFEATGDWFNFYHNLIFSSPAFISHLLLLFFVLAEVTNFITQLYYYRKGI
jgi:cytochrome bd-type quinol oxidase subunit 2